MDHITVVGYAPSGSPNLQDLTFFSFFVDTPSPGGTGLLELLRSGSIATAPVERTAVMGEINANTPRPLPIGSNGLVYLTGLDYLPGIPFSPAGGGVAVDERGRMSVIGAASSAGFPVKRAALIASVVTGVRARSCRHAATWRGASGRIRYPGAFRPVDSISTARNNWTHDSDVCANAVWVSDRRCWFARRCLAPSDVYRLGGASTLATPNPQSLPSPLRFTGSYWWIDRQLIFGNRHDCAVWYSNSAQLPWHRRLGRLRVVRCRYQ